MTDKNENSWMNEQENREELLEYMLHMADSSVEGYHFVKNILAHGFKGINNMTDNEIRQELSRWRTE